MGDVIMATSALEALAERFGPGLTVALRPHLFPLLAGLNSGKNLLPAGRPRSLKALLAERRRWKEGRFDGALLLTRSQESALLAWISGIPLRAGLLDGRGLLLNAGFREPSQPRRKGREPRRIPRYMGDLYADLAALVGVEVEDTRPRLAVLPQEEEEARRVLSSLGLEEGEPFFLLNPGAAFGASKLWPPEHMARAGVELHRSLGIRGVVLSGPAGEEQELALRIAASAPGKPLLPAVGKNLVRLGPLKAVVRKSRLMVTTDSGPRHAAVAFRVPHVVVMGPTDPRFTAKHLEECRVLRKEVDCGPCHWKECPYEHHACMRGIPAEEVVRAALELLSSPSSLEGVKGEGREK